MIRVLCVDDEPLVRRYLTARLAAEPDIYLVAAVPSAAAACASLRDEKVDVILLDYRLEGADGMELLRAMALWYETLPGAQQRPAVLFCTGYREPEFEKRARSLGADGVLYKDQVASDLTAAIRAVSVGNNWFGCTSAAVGGETAEASKIVVAIGEAMVRAEVTRQLLCTRYEVAHAWRSDELLQLLEREPFDVLVMDDRLPGRILVPHLLEQIASRWPGFPALFLAAPPSGMEDYYPCANVAAVLPKPLRGQQLQDELERVLHCRKARPVAASG
jgi:DNA-binding NarL/FixJ family response regulator